MPSACPSVNCVMYKPDNYAKTPNLTSQCKANPANATVALQLPDSVSR